LDRDDVAIDNRGGLRDREQCPTCRERAMVFLKRSYIIGAVLVYQFPRQGTPYETREL